MGIPFELHLTVDPLSSDRLDGFVECCARNGAKPLLIELGRGEHLQQPMLGKVVDAESLESALGMAQKLSEILAAEGYVVRRLKRVDYAMADDFPTINTDLQVKEGGVDRCLIDISFNLDIGVAPVPLLYRPLRGKPFIIPYTVPLALQVSWKLHQTLVRPRIKDLFDLMHLLRHPAFTPEVLEQAKEALRKECEVGLTDPGGARHLLTGDWEKLFGRDIDEEWDFGCCDITDVANWLASLPEFKRQLSQALLEAGFNEDWNGVEGGGGPQGRRSEEAAKKRSFWGWFRRRQGVRGD